MSAKLCFLVISAALIPTALEAASARRTVGPTFATPKVVAGLGHAKEIAIGDVNGDGWGDIAVSNLSGSGVSVFLNRGRGRFRPARLYGTGNEPYAVAIADLTGDKRPDLVTADAGDRGVSVLVNAGNGAFRARVPYATARLPAAVVTGDMNGDGARDLATANLARPGVSVLLNRRDGTFSKASNYDIGHPAKRIAIGDLNGDGRADLATTDGQNVTVLRNTGDGKFSRAGNYRPRSLGAAAVALVDVTGDRKPDILTTAWSQRRGSGVLAVAINRGDGTFHTSRIWGGGGGTSEIAVRDLTGDGFLDVATESVDVPGISVFVNRRGEGFRRRLDYPTSGTPRAFALGDLNGDHRTDIAAPIQASSFVGLAVLINTPACVVQRVTQETLAAARTTLERARCHVGSVAWAPSATVPPGRVIGQRPRIGIVLPPGSKISLIVSRS